MRKTLLLLGICILAAISVKASERFVYYIGNFNNWIEPTENNATDYEFYKLYETTERSNVYSGEIGASPFYSSSQTSDCFRFHTALAPGYNGQSDYEYGWRQNLIHPSKAHYPENRDDQYISTSGTYYADDVTIPGRTLTDEEMNHWWVEFPCSVDKVKITLDLNNMTVEVVTPQAVVPVLDSTVHPSIKDWQALYSIYPDTKVFIPEGNHKLRMYDFWNREWKTQNIGFSTKGDASEVVFDSEAYVLDAWPGGVANISPTWITFDATKYEVPQTVGLMTVRQAIMPTTDNIQWTYPLYTEMPSEGGRYEVTKKMDENAPSFWFYEIKDGTVTPFGPSSSTQVEFQDYKATVNLHSGLSNCISLKSVFGHDITFQMPTSGDKRTLSIYDSNTMPPIYVVGAFTGWLSPTEENVEHYANYTLRLTTTGAYYGEFEIEAGQAQFRFYTLLDSWEKHTYGCQEEDIATNYYTFTDTFNDIIMPGKGVWWFEDWPGGLMAMLVNIDRGFVTFSTTPMEVEYATNGIESVVSTTNQCQDSNVYNLQGIRVGDSTDGLPTGIYIQGGKKVLVR